MTSFSIVVKGNVGGSGLDNNELHKQAEQAAKALVETLRTQMIETVEVLVDEQAVDVTAQAPVPADQQQGQTVQQAQEGQPTQPTTQGKATTTEGAKRPGTGA